MSRSQRLLDLLQLLRRYRYPVSGSTLSEELGISLRTLYRDIATLQAQGAAIDGEAGVGYILRPGFVLPPLMFTTEELEALVLGSRWVARRGDGPLSLAARDALAKIANVLPDELRADLDASTLLVGPNKPLEDNDLPTIREAIRKERKIHIDYQDQAGQSSSRILWPFALGFFERVRVVVAWCELRQDFRHFRTDRLASVTALEERYPRSRQRLLQEWKESQGIPADEI